MKTGLMLFLVVIVAVMASQSVFGETADTSGARIHVVVKGEGLLAIAKHYGFSHWREIAQANGMRYKYFRGDYILYATVQPGQRLIIPKHGEDDSLSFKKEFEVKPGEILHRVNLGDRLFNIAESYGVSAEEIAQRNKMKTWERLRAGTWLVIPHTKNLKDEYGDK